MGCFQSKNNKYKAKPSKIVKVLQGQFNNKWKRLLETACISRFLIQDINGSAEHPAFTSIEKDVTRTFPNHKTFQQKENIDIFKDTLKCYALTFPEVGYTQGLNFIAGYFLIHKMNKFQCLNLLASISVHPSLLFIGLYEDNFPLAYLFCQLFWKILEKVDLELYDCLKLIGIQDHMWIFQWYLTFFLYSFPLDYIPFYLNYIFQYKQFSMVKLSIGIVKFLRDDILNLLQKDEIALSQYLDNLKDLETCMKMLNLQLSIRNSHEIPNYLVQQCLKEIKKQSKTKNFYLDYFCLSQIQRRIHHEKFINRVQFKKAELYNSKNDQKLMQSYKRSSETVQILDQILIESIKKHKDKKYKSNMVQIGQINSNLNKKNRKWKSVAFGQDNNFKYEVQTNVSIVKKFVIPEDKDQ